MVLAVNLSRYLQCLLRQLMEHHVNVGAANDELTRSHVISKTLVSSSCVIVSFGVT